MVVTFTPEYIQILYLEWKKIHRITQHGAAQVEDAVATAKPEIHAELIYPNVTNIPT